MLIFPLSEFSIGPERKGIETPDVCSLPRPMFSICPERKGIETRRQRHYSVPSLVFALKEKGLRPAVNDIRRLRLVLALKEKGLRRSTGSYTPRMFSICPERKGIETMYSVDVASV